MSTSSEEFQTMTATASELGPFGPEPGPSAEGGPSAAGGAEEALVVDHRAAVRPAQAVETKLTRLLQESSLPVSHLQMRGLLRSR